MNHTTLLETQYIGDLTYLKYDKFRWDYRVVVNYGVHGIHRVLYPTRGQDKESPAAVSKNSYLPYGSSLVELQYDFRLMAQALEKEPLNMDLFRAKQAQYLAAREEATRPIGPVTTFPETLPDWWPTVAEVEEKLKQHAAAEERMIAELLGENPDKPEEEP